MLARLTNLALLGLFPLAWMAPIAQAEVTWLFTSEEISIFSGIQQLYGRDPFLAAIVAALAILVPYTKTLCLVYVQFAQDAALSRAMLPVIETLGRFSMADVFLVALYITFFRGVEDVSAMWGLYFFTGCVIASIMSAWAAHRERFETRPRGGDDAETPIG